METAGAVLVLVGFVVLVLLINKAKKAASRALTQKVLYRKRYEQGKHLLSGLTIETDEPLTRIMQQLATGVVVAEPPTGLPARLYVAGRTSNRIDYVYGNRFGDSFRATLCLIEQDGRTIGMLDVARWHHQEGIITAQDWLTRLFEQVQETVRTVDPAATFAEGLSDDLRAVWLKAASTTLAKGAAPAQVVEIPSSTEDAVQAVPAADPDSAPDHRPQVPAVAPITAPGKKTDNWRYVGIIIAACSFLGLGLGLPDELTPVFIITLAIGSAIGYFANRAPQTRLPAVPSIAAPTEATPPAPPPSQLAARSSVTQSAEALDAPFANVTAAPTIRAASSSSPGSLSKVPVRTVIVACAVVTIGIVGYGILSQVDHSGASSSRETASPDASAGEDSAAPVAETAPVEGDAPAFVEYVEGEGGSITINAYAGSETEYSRPAITMTNATEPFFEWDVPLAYAYDCRIGGVHVRNDQLLDHVRTNEPVTLEVTCDGGCVVSIDCLVDNGEGSSGVDDLLATAWADGRETTEFGKVTAASLSQGITFTASYNDTGRSFTIPYDEPEAWDLWAEGERVGLDDFNKTAEACADPNKVVYVTVHYYSFGLTSMTLDVYDADQDPLESETPP